MESNPGPMISLRHALATLAYRASKILRDPPADFGSFAAGKSTRTAVAILAHMGDLLEWALRVSDGDPHWIVATPKPWDEEVARFYAALKALDDRFALSLPLECPPKRLFQGPIADALTHVGQLATLRRRAGSPVKGESYFQADIVIGRVGPDQTPPVSEFR